MGASRAREEPGRGARRPPRDFRALEKGLVWQSIWGGQIGYSLHSEAMADALHRQGVYLMHRPVASVFGGRPLREELRTVADRPIRSHAIQVSYVPVSDFDLHHPGKRVGFSMLEVDGIPADWVDRCNRMDEIWVPSRFNAQTFRESGVETPIEVIPLGVDPEIFHPRAAAFKVEDRYTFLSTFEWGARKAPEILLRAFTEEFSEAERVLLILKVDNRDPVVDVGQEVRAMELPAGRAPIAFLYNQPLPDSRMGSLYRSADCFVLPTRGEGWGMPIVEAMACGLPAIATDWSGPTEFLDDRVGYPLVVEALAPAIAKCPFYEGFRWAQPSLADLRRKMRHVFENREEAAEKGARAAEEVARRWTWAHTADRIVQRLEG